MAVFPFHDQNVDAMTTIFYVTIFSSHCSERFCTTVLRRPYARLDDIQVIHDVMHDDVQPLNTRTKLYV
jgi:hypothetical protein